MLRRDLVLGGALAYAAAASPRRSEAAEPKGPAPGATHRAVYYGQIMQIMFQTSTDLSRFMPVGLTPVDPHRAFIKAERLKIRSPEADSGPAAFTQYQQICITTMASAPGFAPRHRNILMWEDRHWAIGSSMVAAKRYGGVEMTEIFEMDRSLVARGQPVPFFIDVETSGASLMRFAGLLDGKQRVAAPPYSGFFVGGETGSGLQALTLDSAELSRPVHGTGDLSFGQAPNERSDDPWSGALWPATLLKDIRTEGCVFSDLTFTRTYGAEFTPVRP
jgi:hypothetical protein